MSKLVPLMIAGTGAAATAVGGAYILKGSGASNSEESLGTTTSRPENTKISNDLPAKTWEEFKEDGKRGGCATGYFGNVSFKDNVTSLDENNKVDSSYFSTSTGFRSCLVLN